MNTKHDAVSGQEEQGRIPIINLSKKDLCSGYCKEKQNKDMPVKHSGRNQLVDTSKEKCVKGDPEIFSLGEYEYT